ncbi:hypothetical protein [Streptomyces sp. NRRL F-5123]|uniref:hypothetical protein n=1 Tax=Streptomyces sp. NRRL F-5123 TaxID=1463856 RepID=UPI0006944987|nr:hypothetical protein [Streptomyces sp. NRRL F-5123]
MRHKTTALAAATALLLTAGATAATAASAGTGGAKDSGKPGVCAPDRPDSRLENALRNVKIALGANGGKLTDKVVAGFAKDMGISTAQARKQLTALFLEAKPGEGGKPGDGKVRFPFTAAQLAKVLGVPTAKAQAALDALAKLATGPRGFVDESTPAYAAVAHRLGVSPQQLSKALFQLKVAAGKSASGGDSKGDKGGKGDKGTQDGKDKGNGKGKGQGQGQGKGKGKDQGKGKGKGHDKGKPVPCKPGDVKPAPGDSGKGTGSDDGKGTGKGTGGKSASADSAPEAAKQAAVRTLIPR